MQREESGFHLLLGEIDRESDLAVKGIERVFFDDRVNRLSYASVDFGRGVDKGGQSTVGCGVPEVPDKLRPSLVHVACAAGITT